MAQGKLYYYITHKLLLMHNYSNHVTPLSNVLIEYCETGNFHDRKISRFWAIGNFATGKFRGFCVRGLS